MAADGGGCGCQGVRCCLLCEGKSLQTKSNCIDKERLLFCTECASIYEFGSECGHIRLSDRYLDGISVFKDFLNEEEEKYLVSEIDKSPWKVSQSGRRKQDYGPKVNFKKQKMKVAGFTGLPSFIYTFVNQMNKYDILKDFKPVEQCHLDYHADRGAAIDPHFDNWWIWGKRLVTLNLLSSTYLTLSHDESDFDVAVPMPRRSLIVVGGDARFKWKHAVKRNDISGRRIAITLRELGQEFLPGGKSEGVGSELLDIAFSFQGSPIP